MKKLLLLSALLIFACTDDDGNPCVYQPTLTTEAVTNITETSATLNGTIDVYSQNCDTVENILQGFVYSTSSEPTIDDDIVNIDGTSITESLTSLEPNTTYYVRVFLVRPLIGVFYGNEVSFVTEENIEPIDCDVVYLDDNGVTIKAYPCAEIGDVGTVNGVEYTVVDNNMLYEMRGEFGQIITTDFTRLCTTRVTDMYNLFLCYEEFNQPIGNWDVSNVTNMSGMFYGECASHLFNQNISQWNVSNVTNMQAMFFNGYFNQPIGNWNVSNVADMTYMFQNAYTFNQDIADWDVSNVTDMSYMFLGADAFNQDLSLWNVEGVLNCVDFSTDTPQWTLPQPNFTNCNPN
tara:strand:- start:1036 stop:2079 length:1044 start_codon:yes stop_codon:yes gene_type:complete